MKNVEELELFITKLTEQAVDLNFKVRIGVKEGNIIVEIVLYEDPGHYVEHAEVALNKEYIGKVIEFTDFCTNE